MCAGQVEETDVPVNLERCRAWEFQLSKDVSLSRCILVIAARKQLTAESSTKLYFRRQGLFLEIFLKFSAL